MSFADQILAWQAFFTTVAGLAATLAGLLFVGLGLNPRIMAPNGPPGMRVLAAQSFHHFLVLLVIALIALAPTETARPLAMTLIIVGGRASCVSCSTCAERGGLTIPTGGSCRR
jgi:hypothetical protein